MAKKKKSASAEADSTSQNPTVDALKETLKKVEASLLPAVDSFCGRSEKSDDGVEPPLPSTKGLDFIHVKNTLLLSYLIELTVHLRDAVVESSDGESKEEDSNDEGEDSDKKQQQQRQKRRLLEMRTVLDKSRGLDKKLRYQIDKLLASLTDSSAFATGVGNDGDQSDDEGGVGFGDDGQDDPLRHRPDPKSMLDSDEGDDSGDDDEGDDSGDGGEDSDDSGDGMDEDDDLAAARATLSMSRQGKSKKKNKKDEDDGDEDDDDEEEYGAASKKYVAPRLTAVPYTHDVADKRLEKEKRQRRKLRATELAQTLRQQYGDQPETEDVFGGGNSEVYGKQRAASRALAQKEAERIEFEESTMIRLTTSRKDKKEKKRVERMMEGGANLAQIANLGNLVRETEAFGRDDAVNSDDDRHREEAYDAYLRGDQGGRKSAEDTGSRYANGKRRRDPMGENISDGAGRRLKMGKKPKAKNHLQAALYGSSGKPSKGKKKSRR